MGARILLLVCALTGCDALFRLNELPPAVQTRENASGVAAAATLQVSYCP